MIRKLMSVLKPSTHSDGAPRDATPERSSKSLAADRTSPQVNRFRREYLKAMLRHSFEHHDDNWPEIRFGDIVYGDAHKHAQVLFIEFVLDNMENLERVNSLFLDDRSRFIFNEILQYKSMGPLHVKLHTNDEKYAEIVKRIEDKPYGLSLLEKGALRVGRWILDLYHVDALGFDVYSTSFFGLIHFHAGQYFFERENVSIRPVEGDVILDCGACWGDTAQLFGRVAGPQGQVHSFEFVSENIEIFEKNLERNTGVIDNVVLCPMPLGDVDGETFSYSNLGPGTGFFKGPEESRQHTARTTTIDAYVRNNNLDRVDYIKMDIEGFELKALHGARETIARFRPKLAISVYHRPYKDLFEIPFFIKDNFPGYSLYLDHHTIYGEETVLYAIA